MLRFAQGEGFLQMSGTHALVLVDEVFPIDELDAGTICRPPARGRAAPRPAEEEPKCSLPATGLGVS